MQREATQHAAAAAAAAAAASTFHLLANPTAGASTTYQIAYQIATTAFCSCSTVGRAKGRVCDFGIIFRQVMHRHIAAV